MSPRSDDDVDLDVYKEAFENPYELLRKHTFFKDEFVLEESRPKDPFIQSSSSGSDTVSSSSSSHLSTPRDQVVSTNAKTGIKTGKLLNPNNQPNKVIGAKNVSMSLNVSKQKLNSKSVPTVKETDDSSKEASVLRAMATKNAALLASHGTGKNCSENKNKVGASNKKTGGTIIIHGDVDNKKTDVEKTVNKGETKDGKTGNMERKENSENNENPKSMAENNSKVNSGNVNSAKPGNTMSKTETAKPLKSAKDLKAKTTCKTSQPLQVVPTKLSANAIKNAPKSGMDKVDEKTKVSKTGNDSSKKLNENSEKDKTNVDSRTVSNVKMELSPKAQVVNRVKSSCSETAGKGKVDETVSNIQSENSASNVVHTVDIAVNKVTQAESSNNDKTTISKAKTGNESISTTMSTNRNKPSTSAQPANRQVNVQTRNANFNVSKSAGAYQRAAGGTRKSTPNYTPRFSSVNVQKSLNELKTIDNTNVSKGAKVTVQSSAEATSSSAVTRSVSGSNLASQSDSKQTEEKAKKPGSPSDINLAPGVCKSSSLLKSYNMASTSNGSNNSGSQPRTPRSNTKLSSNGSLSGAKDQSNSSQVIGNTSANKNSADKKPLGGSSSAEKLNGSGNIASVNIASKSVSQMPSSSTSDKNNSGSPGLSRSISMSVIEESTDSKGEKSKMSSSDTKIQNHTPNSSGKQRPHSDGPSGATSFTALADKVLKSNGKAPLIDILPSASPRVSKTNYLEPSPKISTPVIVNPFEELEKNREKENQLKLGARGITATEFGFVVEKPAPERSKTQTSLKSRNLKSGKKAGYGKESKPSSASTRGSSGRSRRAKSKEPKSDDASGRPKSGKGNKRVRSGKRKRKTPGENLSKQNEKSDVPLIGGIGWHVATSCIDKSDVDAIVVSQIDSSDSSDGEVDVVRVSPLTLDIPQGLTVPAPLEISSAVSSPRFMEVKPSGTEKRVLPIMDNDGFPPMNLDMTQSSNPVSNNDHSNEMTQNESELIMTVPQDITALLAKLKIQENAEHDTEENEEDSTASTYQQLTSAIHREILKGKLTPIPESPNLTRTQSSLKHVAKTVEAITKFDENLKEDDLNKLLGVTPRNKSSVKESETASQEFQSGSIVNSPQGSGTLSKRPPSKGNNTSKTLQSNKGMVQLTSENLRTSSRNSSSKSKPYSNRQTPVSSADRNERSVTYSNRPTPISSADRNDRALAPKQALSISFNSNIINEIQNNVSLETNRQISLRQDSASKKSVETEMTLGVKPECKERKSSASSSSDKSESVKLDLKTLLTEKMQSTKKMLEETTNSLKSRSWRNKRKISVGDTENITVRNSSMETKEFEIKVRDDMMETAHTSENGSESVREDSEIKTSRSSRKERKFSETKNSIPDDENIDVVIDEILSHTYPSAKSKSTKSANSTLTEADRHLLQEMANHKEASPFYAKEHVRESSSYDDSLTLNKDNPQLMKRFHADKFQMGQKVKAMIDAGADKTKVKAMMDVDNEARQLAKIMNSFRQMELYAGPHAGVSNRSAKKETPRKVESLTRIDQNPVGLLSSSRPTGRPGSAGAGRVKAGKFTEIKQGSTSMIAQDRAISPLAVPQVGAFISKNY